MIKSYQPIYDVTTVNALPMSIKYIGKTEKWGIEYDQWRAMISDVTFDYYTGLGFRKCGVPNPPKPVDVLSALVLDAEATNYNYNDWCAEFGYDIDSQSAFDAYRECLDTGRKLNKIFSKEQLASVVSVVKAIDT